MISQEQFILIRRNTIIVMRILSQKLRLLYIYYNYIVFSIISYISMVCYMYIYGIDIDTDKPGLSSRITIVKTADISCYVFIEQLI